MSISSSLPDRNYANLLAHLRQPDLVLPDETVQSLAAHYLTSFDTPTPLSAALLSSPGLSPLHQGRWLAMLNCFRLSVRAKQNKVEEANSGLFSKPPRWIWGGWTRDVLKGTISSQPINKLACCSGLLLGFGDVSMDDCQAAKSYTEDQAVLALAECMDVYSVSHHANAWEAEFAPPKDALLLSTLLAAQAFHLVPDKKLRALPLERLSGQLMEAVTSAFFSGTFLDSLSSSELEVASGALSIPSGSQFTTELARMQASKPMNCINQLARLTSRAVGMLIELNAPTSLIAAQAAFNSLLTMASNIEIAWSRSLLSQGYDQDKIVTNTREVVKTTWLALKTLLFTTIMISTACLNTLLHTPPAKTGIHSTLALTTIRTLFHLSFVLSQFGGVTTTASSGFPELKQAFYLALDMISVDQKACEDLISSLNLEVGQTAGATPTQQARKAYVLASVEQLIPVLSSGFIQRVVLPLCLPHLSSLTHRETYESAHSVILVIFATRGQRRLRIPNFSEGAQGSGRDSEGMDFEDELIPFYTQCLLENSTKDALSVEQLCLAYSSLVGGACATVDIDTTAQEPSQYALAWSCVESLLALISRVNSDDQKQRLRLTLIACIPSLPLCLLPQTLAKVQAHIEEAHGDERKELVQSLFRVISEHVGDREKEYVMGWWFAHQNNLSGRPEENVQSVRAHALL